MIKDLKMPVTVKKSEVMDKAIDYTALLSNGIFSPCCGCMEDCSPSTCDMLAKWLE